MPAKSKSQQRLFGMALAVRKGEMNRGDVWKEVLEIVDSDMTDKEIEDFASTKHKGLKEQFENMKDIKEYINEDTNGMIQEGKNNLWSEVQNDFGKGGEYHTYSFSEGEKKFKKGFIYINSDDEFAGIQAMNSAKEYEDFLGVDEGQYAELDDMKIGETTEIDDCMIIRIW